LGSAGRFALGFANEPVVATTCLAWKFFHVGMAETAARFINMDGASDIAFAIAGVTVREKFRPVILTGELAQLLAIGFKRFYHFVVHGGKPSNATAPGSPFAQTTQH